MADSKAQVPSPMEQLLGAELLTKVGGPTKSTSSLLADKEVVLIYFSASWCPPCKTFTPLLKKFYTAVTKKGAKLQVVYISSDRDTASFDEYFGNMPWLALPSDQVDVKRSLATQLKVSGIPTLIVLDAKKGFFISDNARYDVSVAADSETKMLELIETWKSTEAVSLDQAVSTLNKRPPGAFGILSFLIKNPLLIYGVYYLIKQGMKHYSGTKGAGVATPSTPMTNVNQPSPIPPPPPMDEEYEF